MSPALTLLALAAVSTAVAAPVPQVLLLDGPGMARVRTELLAGTSALKPALDALRAEADKALDKGPWTVMNKTLVPP